MWSPTASVTVAISGTANLNTGLPVVRETLFQAGSIGKSYTATAIMQLVDDGRVDLDAPLREYLPDLEFADPTVSKTLTARQVLTHTAGIDGDRLDEDFACGRGDDCVERYVAGLDRPAADRRAGRPVVVLQQRLHRARQGHRSAHRDALREGASRRGSSSHSA